MKKRMIIITLTLTVVLLGAACSSVESTVDRAKADRIRLEAADESAARVASEARSQADWEATRESANLTKQVALLFLAITLAVSLLFASAIVLVRLWQASRSLVTYAETRAKLKAGAIHVDRQTLTWPTLVNGDAIHNLQTGEVYRLAEPRLADPQQVTGDAFIRALGAGTRGAVKVADRAKESNGAADAIATLGGALPLVLGGRASDLELATPDSNGITAKTNRRDR